MKSIFRSCITKALVVGVMAATIFTASTASADRNSTISTSQKPVQEYVLTNLKMHDGDGRRDLNSKTAPPATGVGGRASDIKGTTGPASGPHVADDFKAGPGCSIQCITSGVAYARGPNAELVVKTDTLARIWVYVSGPNDYYRVLSSGTDPVMKYSAYFEDLDDGQTYEAWAIAKDDQGYESEGSGSFMTLYRNVTISYSQANLIERAYDSSADFKVGIWLDGEWNDDLFSYDVPADDDVLGLGINSLDLEWVDQYLDFAIELWEAPDYCNSLGTAEQPYFGEGSCSFLSFAALLEGENDLDARPADATSWTEWTLSRTMQRPVGLWPSFSDRLLFEVPVTLHVTYTPNL